MEELNIMAIIIMAAVLIIVLVAPGLSFILAGSLDKEVIRNCKE